MNVEQWAIVVGVAMSAALALGPWMFMVHAKLAVIASQMIELAARIERLTDAHERRLNLCLEHQARLESHEIELKHLEERLRELA